jgi:hypothetical protein
MVQADHDASLSGSITAVPALTLGSACTMTARMQPARAARVI